VNDYDSVVVKRKYTPVLVVVAICSHLCVGVTGIFTGSALQEKKNDVALTRVATDAQSQKLSYEQRLGTQSKQFADEAARHDADIKVFA
jgi:hypothetical protein